MLFLQLVLSVSMVTSVRRNVNADSLIWIKNVATKMENVTVSLDLPVNTAIKVRLIYQLILQSKYVLSTSKYCNQSTSYLPVNTAIKVRLIYQSILQSKYVLFTS